MADKPKGYYSPEAIQSRQQAEIDRANQQREGEKKQAEAQAAQQVVAINPQNAVPAVTIPTTSPTSPKPAKSFLSVGTDKYGNPFYGDGLKGWIRKTFAHVFGEENFKIDQVIADEYKAKLDKRADTFETMTNWDSWGEKVFGLSSKDVLEGFGNVAAAGATSREAVEAGEKTQLEGVGEGVQAAASASSRFLMGNTQGAGLIMGGLQLLSLDDAVVRKITSTSLATEALAGDKAVLEKSWLTGINLWANVPGMISNLVEGKITSKDVKETYKAYWQGSQAVYTMVFDNQVQDEFNRLIAEGRDPELVAQDLGNPWIELAGSVAFSPSTYLGLSVPKRIGEALGLAPEVGKTFWLFGKEKLVYRIPTFGEFLNLGVGSTRLRNVANRFDDVSNINGLDDVMRRFGDVKSEQQAAQIIDEAVNLVTKATNRAADAVDNLAVPKTKSFWGGTFGLTSYTNASKVSVTAREMKTAISLIIKDADSMDDAVAVMSDMAKMARNPGDRAVIARLLKNGKLPFTESGLMTGQMLSRMEDVILPVMQKLEGGKFDKLEIADDIFKGMEKVVSDAIPSVEDMAAAKRAVAAGTATLDQKGLAKLYENVPGYVKAASGLHSYTDKARKLGINLMSNVYMKFSPAYFNRNILSQGINILADMSLADAVEISAKSYRGIDGVIGSTRWTDEVLRINNEKIQKLLNFIPEATARAIGNQLEKTTTTGGFLSAAQNAERVASSEIVLRAARNELVKALPAAIKGAGWDDLAKVLPKEQSNYLFKLLMDNYGDYDTALTQFKNAVGKGEIEAWRVVDIPKQLQSTLDQLKQGDRVKTLMQTAKTQGDFTEGMAKIIGDLEEQARNVYKEMQSVGGLSDDAVKNLVVDSQEIYGDGGEIFRRKVMYWENARIQLKNAVNTARDSINQKLGKIGDPGLKQMWQQSSQELQAIQNTEGEFYRTNNNIRDLVRKLYKDKTASNLDLVEQAIYGTNWSLKADFPDVDWNKLTRAEFNDYLWKSYFKTADQGWSTWNVSFMDDQLQALEDFSQAAFKQGLDVTLSSNKGDSNPFKLAFEYRKVAQELAEVARDGSVKPTETVFSLAEQYAIKKQAILNTVNKYLPEGAAKFAKGDNIPADVAKKAFEARRVAKGLPDMTIPPAAYNGEQPSFARALYESMPKLKKDIKVLQDSVLGEWGKTVKTLDTGADEAMNKFAAAYKQNHKVAQTKAGLFANQLRDYILHDYEKTNLDMAMSYLMPFQYWTTRTYARWMERFVENPKYANIYLKYKETMSKEHSELPEWWRYNVRIPSLPGINNDPIFFNLEATLNPLYGILGTDFNDPYKRVDWVSRLVDDANKAGPTLAPMFNWAVALHLYNKGQDDAAQRWMGRLFPQTAFIKTLLTKMGADINLGPLVQKNEFDPSVNLLMGGLDPYERNRVARNLAGLVGQTVMMEGQPVLVTEEMAIDASAAQEGELWDYAIKTALDERAAGQTFSFFAGVGFKTRTEGDARVDQFYSDYHKLIAVSSLMPPDEYREAWDDLREKYPFMDTVLIGKKAGAERDTALAYNVLSRIPPGELSDIAVFVGLKPYMLESFYENKGDLSKMTPQDRDRFTAAIIDLSAMLKMPDGATREEWTLAKQTYAQMNEVLQQQYGADIQDKISRFYDLPSGDRDKFLQAYPEVESALQDQNAYITNTPILSAYYGGIDTTARYYNNQMYMQLDEEFGENISDIVDQYYMLKDNLLEAEAKAFYKQNNLKAYFDKKKELQAESEQKIMQAASQIPEGRDYTIRPDFQAQSGIQEDIFNYASTDQQAQTAEQIWAELSPASQELLQGYFDGEDLPPAVERQVEYIAKKYGLSKAEALRLLGVEIGN